METCRVYMAGEFAGNVEVEVLCNPSLAGVVLELLRLQISGTSRSESSVASRDRADGIGVCFHSEVLEVLDAAPRQLTLLWEDEPIAQVAPVLTGSVPTERVHSLTPASEICPAPREPPTEPVRWVAVRPWLWLVPAFLLVSGAALISIEPATLRWTDPIRVAAGAMLGALGVWIARFKAWVPTSEIWFVPHEARVAVIEEPRKGAPNLRSATYRRVDEFAHVRIFHCRYAAALTDDGDSEEWIVGLEGPVPFSSPEGDIHLRADAFTLSTFRSEGPARHLAALVSYHTGLPILQAGRF